MKKFSTLMLIVVSVLLIIVLSSCTPKDIELSENDGGNDDKGIILSFDTVYAYAQDAGYTGTMAELVEMFKGDSAYEIAVANGYSGTEAEWLATLIGATGKDGKDGTNGLDGLTPKIGTNGNWWIGQTDTGVKAQGVQGPQGQTGNGIASITKITNGLTDIYTLTYTNGSTYDIIITNGATGATGQNGITPSIGGNGNWYFGETDSGVLAEGKDGVGISGITKTTEGLVDSYVITYTDGTIYSFTLNNGIDGKNGLTPEIGINGNWWIGETDTGVNAQGDKGETGNGIASIDKVSNGLVDTYTITYTNGTTYELIVTNGANGLTPEIGVNGNWWVGGSDTTVPAQGETGNGIDYITKTSNGLTDTYTIHFTNGEGYSFDVTNAPSTLMVKVTFDAEGGVINDSYTYLDLTLVDGTTDVYECDFNAYNSIKELPIPTKENLVFAGWYTGTTINDSQWFNNGTISGDITLYARWTDNKYSLEVVSNDYTLGIPEYVSGEYQANQTILLVAQPLGDNAFVGWYDQDDNLLSTRYTYSITKQPKSEKIVAKFTDKYPLFELDTRNTYHVVGYVGAPTEIIIPAEYNGAPVHYIDESAFADCISLNNIVIPNSVLSIGEKAFYNCSAIYSVVIPNSVTSIGSAAFNGCVRLIEVYNLSSLSITAGNSSNGYISYYAKNIYTSLDTPSKLATDSNGYVIYTDGTDKILVGYTGSATEIMLSTDITQIYKYAFYNCSNLTSVTIPDTIKRIEGGTFSGCSSLESITLPFVGGSASSSTVFGYMFGTSFYIGSETVQYYSTASESYTTYYIPISLKSVTITGGKILSKAFYNSSNLTSITIRDAVISIEAHAISGCSNVTIYCEAESKPSGWDSDWNYDGRPVVWGASENAVVDGVKYGLKGTNAIVAGYEGTPTELEIPSTITYNGVTYNVIRINANAFSNCSSLTSVVIPDSVTSIGSYAFRGCSSLTSVVIGNSVTSIGDYAFYYCSNVRIYCEAESKPSGWSSYWNYDGRPVVWGTTENAVVDGIKYGLKGTNAIVICYEGTPTELEIPSTITYNGVTYNVTSINEKAFYNCDSLTSVVIPASVVTIGSSAFNDCDGLTSIEIPDSVKSIGSYAFYSCDKVKSVVIGNSVETIYNNAFGGGYIKTGDDSITMVFKDKTTWYYTDDSVEFANKESDSYTTFSNGLGPVWHFYNHSHYYWYKL